MVLRCYFNVIKNYRLCIYFKMGKPFTVIHLWYWFPNVVRKCTEGFYWGERNVGRQRKSSPPLIQLRIPKRHVFDRHSYLVASTRKFYRRIFVHFHTTLGRLLRKLFRRANVSCSFRNGRACSDLNSYTKSLTIHKRPAKKYIEQKSHQLKLYTLCSLC